MVEGVVLPGKLKTNWDISTTDMKRQGLNLFEIADPALNVILGTQMLLKTAYLGSNTTRFTFFQNIDLY